MDIVIVLDWYSGHLFHDLEMYIVAFEKLKNHECNNIYFLKPYADYDESKIRTNWSNILCLKLFNKSNFYLINDLRSLKNPLVVDRNTVDTRNINKAFPASIRAFPTKSWSDCFNNDSTPKNFNILYAFRNSTRYLDDESHTKLLSIISKYDESYTMADMGTLSCQDQIDTFRKHNVVIGVHGNNLSGLMWMRPESFVFEILPLELKDSVYDYHCMALCMKHNYTQVDCNHSGLNSVYTLTENSLRAIDYNLKLIYNVFKY